jgi:hypothetical protein
MPGGDVSEPPQQCEGLSIAAFHFLEKRISFPENTLTFNLSVAFLCTFGRSP